MAGYGSPVAVRSWKREVLLLAVAQLAYTLARLAVTGPYGLAREDARRLLDAERLLGLNIEPAVNAFVTTRPWLAVPSCFAYASLHDAVTVVILVWLWRCRPASYDPARTALLVTAGAGLIGYSLFPLAPPRMMPGFLDAMRMYAGYGWWTPPVEHGDPWTNEFAAMPSLHVAFAIWAGWAVWTNTRDPVARGLAVLYPACITGVVVGTANHYVLDVVAGAAIIYLATVAGRSKAAQTALPPVTRGAQPHAPLRAATMRRPRPVSAKSPRSDSAGT